MRVVFLHQIMLFFDNPVIVIKISGTLDIYGMSVAVALKGKITTIKGQISNHIIQKH